MGDSIQIKISAIDDFSKVVQNFKNEFSENIPGSMTRNFSLTQSKLSQVKENMGDLVSNSKEVTGEFNRNGQAIISLGAKFTAVLSGLTGGALKNVNKLFSDISKSYKKQLSKGGNLTQIWEGHWKSIVVTSMAAIGEIASGISSRLGNALNSAAQGFQLGAQFGGVTAVAGGIIGGMLSWFSGPSNEELMAQYGAEAGKVYGSAWSEAVEGKMWEVAKKLPTAASGKFDFIAAAFHPDTVQVALDGLTEFGNQIQEKFGQMFEDDVKPVLMNILGMSETEAAEAMAPLFETAIAKALEFGQALSPTMERMLAWAKNLGVEINISAGNFEDAFNKLINSAEISVEQFKNLRDLALQVGVDIDATFSKSLESFLADSEFSIEKLQGIALAAQEAGYNIKLSFDQAIAASRDRIMEIRGQLTEMGNNSLNWFLNKMNLRQQRKSYRQNYLEGGAEDYLNQWEQANKRRLEQIDQLSGAERKEAQKAYDLEKQQALKEGKEKSQQRYNELLERANSINIDGKHDIKDIREAIKDLPEEEKKIVLELARQKQERVAHRQEMKKQKEMQKKLREQIKAQKDLISSINKLAENITGNFGNMSNNLPDTSVFASDMDKAYQQWKYMAEHPLNASVTTSSVPGISAAAGVDLTMNGPASGYHVPLTMHGAERLQVTPLSSHSDKNYYPAEIYNISQHVHVHNLDAANTEQWLRKTGLPMMARQIKTEVTGFKRNIIRGDA